MNRHQAKPYEPEPGVRECRICGGQITGEDEGVTHVDERRNPSGPVPLPEKARARTDDLDTSHAAAASVGPMRTTHRAVLDLLRTYPEGLTDEEMVTAYTEEAAASGYVQQSPSGLRSRRAELTAAGHVIDTGQTRRTIAGRASHVWTVNPESEGL